MPLYIRDARGRLMPLNITAPKKPPAEPKAAPKAEPTLVDQVTQPPPKATDKPDGSVVARIAKLDVVDLQSDINLPGCVGSGQDVILSYWQHSSWDDRLPVGAGRIAEEAGYLVFRGRFFTETSHGLDTWKTVRGLAARCEWSFGFLVLKSHHGQVDGQAVRYVETFEVHECSPVLKGASVGSATLAVGGKSLKYAVAARDNHTALVKLKYPNVDAAKRAMRRARRLGVDVPAAGGHK